MTTRKSAQKGVRLRAGGEDKNRKEIKRGEAILFVSLTPSSTEKWMTEVGRALGKTGEARVFLPLPQAMPRTRMIAAF